MQAERLVAIYRELVNTFWEKERTDEHIFAMLTFLKNYIPFEHAIFQTTNTETFTVTNFIEYSSQVQNVGPYSFHNKYQRDPDIVYDLYGRIGKDYIILHDAKEDESIWKYLNDMNYSMRSVLSSVLFADEKYRRRHLLLLLAEEPGVFSDEHGELLSALREPLQKLAHDFYVGAPDNTLMLGPAGPLPTTSEEQLRRCPGLRPAMRLVDVAAPTACSVLIQGPTGSGKELVAETLHALSPRRAGPLIRVNCGALPESLLDSELFGFEKGAFTGALQAHKGFFERAHHGTIYLDEVGELSKSAQARLLRVLETKEIQRIGAEWSLSLDVRVIAATHCDLWDMVRRGEFREDLCYRLHVFPIRIPALDERKEDIAILAEYFYHSGLRQFELRDPPALSASFLNQLVSRRWPGNVRELQHAIERSLLLCAADHLPEIRLGTADAAGMPGARPERSRAASSMIAMTLEEALAASGGRIQGAGGAAELLGLHPATLRYRMRKAGIPLPRQRGA